jgi:hypothetical protein
MFFLFASFREGVCVYIYRYGTLIGSLEFTWKTCWTKSGVGLLNSKSCFCDKDHVKKRFEKREESDRQKKNLHKLE